ncbi:glutaredoxin [Acidovorax sp. 69]|nr:glutaredoxin family protein [Acidovorax sp. 69]PJI97678.1 glutaredoxin [Acidovorax sp. 69]
MQKTMLAPLLASLLLVVAGAQAQGVYRIVGPDGKVTFSDRPPADDKAPPPSTRANGAAPTAASGAALPYELRQIASRFPVTIYTGNDCAPCGSLRIMLSSRGVPFTERTIATNEDISALQRLSGSTSLPFGTIGGQQLTGYSDGEWAQYLDAAGYPKQSQLPGNYRQPAPTPLVAVKPVEAAPAAESRATPPARPAPAAPVNEGPTPSNPAGIRF